MGVSCTCAVCATGRSRKAATAAQGDACNSWDWNSGKKAVLLVIDEVMQVDLKALFKGLPATERLVNLCIELVSVIAQHQQQAQHCELA